MGGGKGGLKWIARPGLVRGLDRRGLCLMAALGIAPKCGDLKLLLSKALGRLNRKLLQGVMELEVMHLVVLQQKVKFAWSSRNQMDVSEGGTVLSAALLGEEATLKLVYEELRRWKIAEKWVTLA
ncbi:hypothetical protein DUI87_14626 [Hirundo rustica rustica]|uniref:Uncharacterized protein n=1 Tax=Hirundo rustica rustica TaxID=333673 RepID=A0A3M0K5B8_HIRRU|nr:hypothetical protein DUI87_14626 [Hirundo rustica rustica]